jgi:hypothetical protein
MFIRAIDITNYEPRLSQAAEQQVREVVLTFSFEIITDYLTSCYPNFSIDHNEGML